MNTMPILRAHRFTTYPGYGWYAGTIYNLRTCRALKPTGPVEGRIEPRILLTRRDGVRRSVTLTELKREALTQPLESFSPEPRHYTSSTYTDGRFNSDIPTTRCLRCGCPQLRDHTSPLFLCAEHQHQVNNGTIGAGWDPNQREVPIGRAQALITDMHHYLHGDRPMKLRPFAKETSIPKDALWDITHRTYPHVKSGTWELLRDVQANIIHAELMHQATHSTANQKYKRAARTKNQRRTKTLNEDEQQAEQQRSAA